MRFILLFCAAALFLPFAEVEAADTTALTTAIQRKYESMRSFSATFTQRLKHQESGAEERRNGSMLFEKPFRLRWETAKPDAELLVVNEKEVWDYLPEEELAYRYSPAVVNDSASVIQVVTGQSRLDKDFSVETEPDEEGLAVLRLYPKEPSTQMVEVILWVDKGTKLIRRARVLDFYGNTNELAFTGLTPDASVPSGAFRFTPPKGVTVEDLQGRSVPERPLLK